MITDLLLPEIIIQDSYADEIGVLIRGLTATQSILNGITRSRSPNPSKRNEPDLGMLWNQEIDVQAQQLLPVLFGKVTVNVISVQ